MAIVAPILPARELSSPRLRLRGWQETDAPRLYDAARESVASIGPWLPWCHAGYTLTDAQAWIAHCQAAWRQGGHYTFAITDATDGSLLGGIGLNQRNLLHRSANLGYWVRQSRQQQGICVEAAKLAARFGFDTLDLVRIEIIAAVDNRPSRRVAERCGAQFEGISRQRLVHAGRVLDAAVYGWIPTDLAEQVI